MKIDDRISNYMALVHGSTGGKEKQQTPESAGMADISASSEVEISTTAAQLADDEARRARLNSIRQQLAEGSYNISGKDVASKILSVIKG